MTMCALLCVCGYKKARGIHKTFLTTEKHSFRYVRCINIKKMCMCVPTCWIVHEMRAKKENLYAPRVYFIRETETPANSNFYYQCLCCYRV